MEKEEQESPFETFGESMNVIAEKIRGEKTAEKQTEDAERKKHDELEQIRKHLRQTYAENSPLESAPPVTAKKADSGAYLSAIDDTYRSEITDLLQSAVTDGIWSAVRTVRKKDDPYFIDAFHDALTYFLHEKMQDQNLL